MRLLLLDQKLPNDTTYPCWPYCSIQGRYIYIYIPLISLRVRLSRQILTFCVSGSINQFQAPVAVQTDTTISITERKHKNKILNQLTVEL